MNRRFRAWLPNSLRTFWIPAGLLGGIAAILAYCVDQANWVWPDHLIVQSIFLGLVFGWLLAKSRFSGWLVGFYSVDLAVLVILLSMAGIFTVLASFSDFAETGVLETMNLRAFTLVQRFGGWYQALRAGKALDDTGLFLFLASLLGWLVTTDLVWNALKRQRVYAAILPIALLLGVNNHLSQQGGGMFWVFLILALLLIFYAGYQFKHRDWDERQVDYPEFLGTEWVMSAIGVTMVISTLALMVTIFGTPSGWEALSRVARDLRKQSEPAAQQLFGGVTPPKFEAPALFARTPDLSDFRSGLPQGDQTIMLVKTSDPAPAPRESGAAAEVTEVQHYWRSNVYTVYTPTGWRPVGSFDAQPPQRNPEAAPPGRYRLDQEYDILSAHDGQLFAANQPIQGGEGTALLYRTLDDTALLSGSASTYQVSSWATQVTGDDLDAASPQIPPEITAVYLQLPDTLPPRVGQLAGRIAGSAEGMLDKTLKIQDYLRQTYSYSTQPPPTSAQGDFVDHFLFEGQAGYCTHFASAMAVMLRTQGIPARVATGYAAGMYDYQEQAYRVTASNAHAWVEVFFPGFGWVEFEPTPSQATFQYSRRGQPTPEAPPTIPPPAETPTAPPRSPWPLILAGLMVTSGLAGLYFLFIHPTRGAAGGLSGQLYWNMRRMLAWAGLKASPASTPGEFLQRHRRTLLTRAPLLNAAQEITSLYQRAAFGRRPPQQAEIEAARRAWSKTRGDWLRLLFQRIWIALRRGKR